MPRFLGSLALVALLALSAAGGGTSAPTRLGHFSDKNLKLSFDYPGSWHLRRADPAWTTSSFGYPIVYASTQPLHGQCKPRTASYMTSITCGRPLDRLDRGGILVTVSLEASPIWTLAKARGKRVKIAGRPAKLATDWPGACHRSVNAGETITTSIQILNVTSNNWIDVQVCLRRPGLVTGERQVRSILSSLELRGSKR
jgi:hypothetical protein